MVQKGTCVQCGAAYVARRTTRIYCSRACNERARRTRREVAQCIACGTTFMRVNSGHTAAQYCSSGCWPKVRAKPYVLSVVVSKPCAYCGTPTHGRKACCSPRCYVRHRDGLPRWYQCAHCATTFDALSKGNTQANKDGERYCSRPCWHRAAKSRYRHKKRANGYESISMAKVAERDGWRCHICKRKVSTETWSLDHLIPVSYGGSHTYTNVALAHHACNTKRSNTGAAQLRLVG